MVTKHMAHFGRVSICGSIANYNDTEKAKCKNIIRSFEINSFNCFLFLSLDPQINMDILLHELTIRGFMVYSYQKEFPTAFNELTPLVKKVKDMMMKNIFPI